MAGGIRRTRILADDSGRVTSRLAQFSVALLVSCMAALAIGLPGAVAAQGQARHALAEAKRHHGLPEGVPVPAWADGHGRHPYFAPPGKLPHGHGKPHGPKASSEEDDPMTPGEGPSWHGGNGEAHPINELGLRCESGYCPPPPLRYSGGVVQHEPKVHLVFWGSNWNLPANTASREKILELFEVLSGSAYQGILTQYFDGTGRVSSNISYDTFTDTRVGAPSEVTFSSMEPEVAYAIEQKEKTSGWKREPNAQFMLLTAPGTTYKSGFGSFCAYHDYDSKGGIFSIVPWAGDAPFSTTSACSGYYGGGSALKATSVMASHEYAESATDPIWDAEPGWQNLEGYELTDMCATPYDEIPGKGGAKVYVQGQYDDHQNACSLEDKEPPHVLALTDTATNVTRYAARINATINPEGASTTYYFEYGKTTSYGTNVPIEAKSAGSGIGNVMVYEDLAGLTTGQIYHYRVRASNSSGTTYGEDRTFLPSVWTIRPQVEPERTGASWLNDVDCMTRKSCVAVGHYYHGTKGGNQALAYVGSGAEWSWTPLPAPESGTLTNLEGVSCPSPTVCIAVGRGKDAAGNVVPRAARWEGGAWTLQSVPLPAGSTYTSFTSVSCPTNSECIAVGYSNDSGGVFRDYSSRWSAGAWSNLSTPNPSSGYSQSQLEGVSCAEVGYCEAVGWYNPSSGGSAQKVILTWNGSTWSLQSAAISEGFLSGIDCKSTSFCMAVGGWGTAVERWNGTSWASQTTPSLSDATGGVLFDVDCVSSTKCTTVGGAFSKINGLSFTLVENWDGTSWTVEATPRESEQAYNELRSVSCQEFSSCAAIGQTLVSGTWEPLMETRPVVPVYESTFGSTGSGNGQLKRPLGMALDASGNLWVADSQNNRIQEFNSEGKYVAQFGESGSKDGQFSEPKDLAFDAEGNIWVTDAGNARVQKFTPGGKYLTKFGSPGTGQEQFVEPWGIAIDQAGNIWVTDARYYRVKEFTSSGTFIQTIGKMGSGNGQFETPKGITIGPSGHIWVADYGNNRVQELSSTGAYLSQFGTKGQNDGQFEFPTAIDVLPSGDLLVADRYTSRLQQFAPNGKFETSFGEGLTEPEGMVAAPTGQIYVANSWGNSIKKWFEPAPPKVNSGNASEITSTSAKLAGTLNLGGIPTTYRFEYDTTKYQKGEASHGTAVPVPNGSAGSGKSDVEVSQSISGLQTSTTYHYRLVASNENGVVFGEDVSFNTPAGYLAKFGSEGTGNGQFKEPIGAAVDSSGNVWVVDSGNNRVQKFNSNGEYLSQFGSTGTGNGQFKKPLDIAITSAGDLWVTDGENNRVQKFNSKGEYLTKFGSGGTGNGQFTEPWGIDIGPNGHIWVADGRFYRIEEFTATGEFVRKVGGAGAGSGNGEFWGPRGLAIDTEGHVWVADSRNNRIQEFSSTGTYMTQFGTYGTGAGQFDEPYAVAIRPSGALIVMDRRNGRGEQFTSSGGFLSQFATKGTGTGQLREPQGIALATDGTIFVADTANGRMEKWK